MIWTALVVTVVLLGILGITVVNLFTFPRLAPSPEGNNPPQQTEKPLQISLLIPARNEAAVIRDTLTGLLKQTGATFEVLLLDDHSTDNTAALALEAARGDPRLRVLAGEPLPAGWGGKNWACHQLAAAATGEWLVFTDADVTWRPGALASLTAALARTQADLLTVWPTQVTITWAERLVVPLMALVILGYLPVLLVHHLGWPAFAAANGQCMAFRRRAYTTIGGHAAVAGRVLEDVTLARRVKAHGLRLRMIDAAGMLTCRMYHDWPSVRDGYAKNILAGYGSIIALLLATLFHWLIFLGPWLWLALGWTLPPLAWPTITGISITPPTWWVWPTWPLLLLLIGVFVRGASAAKTQQRIRDAAALPVSVLLMTIIAGRAVYWQIRYGGPRWKGRVIRSDQALIH